MMRPTNPINLLMNWSLCSTLWLVLLTSSLIFLFTMDTQNKTILEWGWLMQNSNYFSITFMLDNMGMMFISVVSMVAMNTFMFSELYMMGDNKNYKFSLMLILFVASMMIFIVMPNMITMMVGWDGLGITSFMLIMHYLNPKSGGGASVTLLTNRLGDATLMMSMVIFSTSGSWNLFMNGNSSFVLNLLIMMTGMSKSSQIPLCMWLPEAMAAPTPVSALVHSSTLVTAGVFLLIRFFNTLNSMAMFKPTMIIMGSLTMLGGGVWALTMMDMKKVIALSTMSQLGLMMTSLGMGQITLAFYHLCTHAMFKSLMFITAGTSIMMKTHMQDSYPTLTYTWGTMVSYPMMMSLLSLNAFPFLSGWFSKELILEMLTYQKMSWVSTSLMATVATALYSIRIWSSMVCHGELKPAKPTSIMNKTKIMYMPMMLLALGSVSVGAMLKWFIFKNNMNIALDMIAHYLPLASSITGTMIYLSHMNWYKVMYCVEHSKFMWGSKTITMKISSISTTSSLALISMVEQGLLMKPNMIITSTLSKWSMPSTTGIIKINLNTSLTWMIIYMMGASIWYY